MWPLYLNDCFENAWKIFEIQTPLHSMLWVYLKHRKKVGISPSSKKCVICFNESPSKMMKNAFYFIVFKIFKCLSWLFGHVEKKGLIRKIGSSSKFMTSQPGYQTWKCTYFLTSYEAKTSRKWNIFQRKIYLEKLCRNWGIGTRSRPPFSTKWYSA